MQEGMGRQSQQDMDKWSHSFSSGFSAISLLCGKEGARHAAEPWAGEWGWHTPFTLGLSGLIFMSGPKVQAGKRLAGA